jgi:argonaute-like protein implicated in RNA metabolism and viral defense
MHDHAFHTVVGEISFGKDGEWTKSRVVFTQFQNVTNNSMDQFKDTTHELIVWPDQYKSGKMNPSLLHCEETVIAGIWVWDLGQTHCVLQRSNPSRPTSANGTKRTSQLRSAMFAFGGKADITSEDQNVRF